MSTDCENLLKKFLILNPARRPVLAVSLTETERQEKLLIFEFS